MANSSIPGQSGASQSSWISNPPGTVGTWSLSSYLDSPGPLGINDWAGFTAIGPQRDLPAVS